MNRAVITWLKQEYGYTVNAKFYSRIKVWEAWWKGFHKPFHRIRYETADGKPKFRDMYTMKMAKKITEDWASLLINDKTKIVLGDQHSSEWLQGENELGGILGLSNFWDQANDLMERMMWSGTCAILPKLVNAAVDGQGRIMPDPDMKIKLNYLSADLIIPLSVDNGIITEAAFCSEVCVKGQDNLYLEVHTLEDGEYVIRNHLFSVGEGKKTIREEQLPEGTVKELRTGSARPWFAICRPAVVSSDENANGLGSSIYADAIDNLKGVDLAFNNFNQDLYLGQKKVFISKDLMSDMGGQGDVVPDDVNQQLFCMIGSAYSEPGKSPVTEHNPALRVTDNTDAVQAQLDYLSFKVGFGTKHYQFNAGSIVTATQYTGDKQDMIQNAHKHFIKVEQFLMHLTRTLLEIGSRFIDSSIDPDTKIEIMFDQSPLIDENAERQRDKDDVSAGLMQKWEYRVKWYGETEEDAKKALADGEPTDDELMGFGQEGFEEGED